LPTTESLCRRSDNQRECFFARYYIFSVDCAQQPIQIYLPRPAKCWQAKKAISVRCACSIELFIRMQRECGPAFYRPPRSDAGRITAAPSLQFAVCAACTTPSSSSRHTPTHPPLPSTTLCVEHHLIDLSLYCVLCVRNDAPAVCLLVFLAGGYFYRETILEMKSSDPSRTGPRSKAKNRDGGGAGDATLLLFVSSACVRRVVVVYFLWLLSNGGRFG